MINFTVRKALDGEIYIYKCFKCGVNLMITVSPNNRNYFNDIVCWKCLEMQPDIVLLKKSRVDRYDYHFLSFDRKLNAESNS